jgi:hypothetical protein
MENKNVVTINQQAWYQFNTLKDCLRNSKEKQCSKKKILRKMKPKWLRDKPQRVYKMPCRYGKEYVSETNRPLGVRILIYLCTLWSTVLLEKLNGSLLVNKFSSFYGIQRFITTFTSAHHLSLSCARSIQSIPPHPTS